MQWHDVQQNSDEWFSLRLGKATASKFGCIMANEVGAFGEPAKDYALQLALERITGVKAEFSFTNEHMERGHEQEPVARMLYEDDRFVDVGSGGFFDLGMYGDSPDGLVSDDGVIEIKSVLAKTHYATQRRESYDPAYKWQLVGHLYCTGRSWVDFISYCSDFPEGKQLIVHRLTWRESGELLSRLERRLTEFLAFVDQVVESIGAKA